MIVTVFPNELPTLAPKDRNILVSIWQDSNKVGFCTTIHNGTEWVVRNWKRPKETSTYTVITKQPFYMFNPPAGCKELYEHTRLLPILGAIDDYNHHMGGVDIAVQLWAGFTTQQQRVKPWRPLFYGLLDSASINAFQIPEHQRKAQLGGRKDKV
jgi:hypothetical protein